MAIIDLGDGTIRVENDAGFVRVTITNENRDTVSLAALTVVEAEDLYALIKRTVAEAEKSLDKAGD